MSPTAQELLARSAERRSDREAYYLARQRLLDHPSDFEAHATLERLNERDFALEYDADPEAFRAGQSTMTSDQIRAIRR
jgi:hypothetical protein